jgi:spore coat polysaccharide biosynthesis protein SpsF
MKIGILITARLGSTRLEKKHMLPVEGHPILYFLIRRIAIEFHAEVTNRQVAILIATSDETENTMFECFLKDGVNVFYGSVNNIPLRHLQAAKSYDLDAMISVDGDDILCSVKGMRTVYDRLNKGSPYVRTSGLPFGMNSMGYSRQFLESALGGRNEKILETGWGRIFDQSLAVDIAMPFPVQDDALRFTLDYDEDYHFFESLITALGEHVWHIKDEDIAKLVLDNKIYVHNEPIARQYWNNFYKMRDIEEQQ